MFPTASLLSFLGAALALCAHVHASPLAAETPKAALPFNTRFFSGNGTATNIVERDLARIAHLKEKGYARAAERKAAGEHDKRAAYSFSVTNAVDTYTANVGVGNPPTYYTLLIDTGSSNTWVGADQKYVKTKTSKSTGKKVSVSYGSGSFSGTEYTDTVTLSSDLVITQQSIGVASTATGFDGVDGILGIGPVDLTSSTVSGTSSVPTVSDNLHSQGTISTEVIGISYAPATSESDANGELTFGGPDSSKYTGSIAYVPLTTTSPASEYWGIDQSLKYGSTTLFSTTAGIVDTGTTLFYVPSSAFSKYATATGGKADKATGLLKITAAQYAKLSDLDVVIGGKTYALSANAQIWPRSLNSAIGGTANSIYLTVVSTGTGTGTGLDFILGYVFLERYYSVFDTTNKRIGFATTSHTSDTTN